MAGQIPQYSRFPGTTFSCYELYFILINNTYTLTWRRLAGDIPDATDAAEIVVKLDWRQLANNSYNTYQVASYVVPHLLETNFITEWPGHALAELSIHLIGHSRGGSLICEMSRLLGTNGVWVDHLTTLDPHPLNNDGFSDFPYTVIDAPAHTYQNVLFHDNYFQKLNTIANGEPVVGAYIRQLTNLDGGYGGLTGSHSDVHLWYHGTVDLQTPADDSVASITAVERQNWWNNYETQGSFAGFYYSRIAGGDRLSTDRPAGAGQIRDGYNQSWDLGLGVANNRTVLSTNQGNWPNLIKLDLVGTNLVAHGQNCSVTFYYQWARPDTTNALVSLFLDDDFNPSNGNENLLRALPVTGTTANQIGSGPLTFTVDATNAAPGYHSLFGKITALGRTRYLYAPQILTVMSSFAPPRLELLSPPGTAGLPVTIDGLAGQRLVLQSSSDLLAWQSIATNWLTQSRWTYLDPPPFQPRKFYRAAVR